MNVSGSLGSGAALLAVLVVLGLASGCNNTAQSGVTAFPGDHGTTQTQTAVPVPTVPDPTSSAASSPTSSATGSPTATTPTTPAGDPYLRETPTQMVRASLKTTLTVSSVHLTGHVPVDGKRAGVDATLTGRGDCSGTYRFTTGSIAFLHVGDKTWFRPDDAYWRATEPSKAQVIIDRIAGRYVVLSGSDAAPFDRFCDLHRLLAGFHRLGGGGGVAAPGPQVDGRPTLGIGDLGAAPVLLVFSTGQHHFARISHKPSAPTGVEITFGDYDKPVHVRAPRPSDVVDLGS